LNGRLFQEHVGNTNLGLLLVGHDNSQSDAPENNDVASDVAIEVGKDS